MHTTHLQIEPTGQSNLSLRYALGILDESDQLDESAVLGLGADMPVELYTISTRCVRRDDVLGAGHGHDNGKLFTKQLDGERFIAVLRSHTEAAHLSCEMMKRWPHRVCPCECSLDVLLAVAKNSPGYSGLILVDQNNEPLHTLFVKSTAEVA